MGNRAVSDLSPCGVILAGGEGRRMGGVDKALVPLHGLPLITHVQSRFAPQVRALAISAQGDAGRFAALGLPVIADTVPGGLGPLAGVLAGMIWAAGQGAGHLACVPVDGPFLPLDLVQRLACAAVPRLAQAGGRAHPTFGLWPVALAGDLHSFLTSGARPKVMDFAVQAGAEWVRFDDASSFDNLNTPDDLARAEAQR